MRLIATIALVIALLSPLIARAADSKGPLDYPLKQYGLMLGIAVLGGVVSWYGKVRAGVVQAASVTQLVGEIATSAFAGLLAFWVAEWAGTPPMLQAALVGIAGHMGTKAINALEQFAQARLEAKR